MAGNWFFTGDYCADVGFVFDVDPVSHGSVVKVTYSFFVEDDVTLLFFHVVEGEDGAVLYYRLWWWVDCFSWHDILLLCMAFRFYDIVVICLEKTSLGRKSLI